MQSDAGHAVAAGITGKLLRALNWFQRRAGALIIASMLALAVFHEVKKNRPIFFLFPSHPLSLFRSLPLSLSLHLRSPKKAMRYRFSILDVTTFSLVKGASISDIKNDRVSAKGHGRNKPSIQMQPSKRDKVMTLYIISYLLVSDNITNNNGSCEN